jgi:hypothetical protein
MRYLDEIKLFFSKAKQFFIKTKTAELQPKDILSKLLSELEQRKKLGIEENAFAPNVYAVYLSPLDYDELSPLLSGIRDRLKNKLMERIKKQDYRLLSSGVSLEIREDNALERNQVVVESSFLKEKTQQTSLKDAQEENKVVPLEHATSKQQENQNTVLPGQRTGMTKIMEDKVTRIIDKTKLMLKIIEGENKGEIINLQEGEYTFGRGKDAVILIKDCDDTVSRVHFKITVKEGKISIRDMDSSNGTRVNDIEIEQAELKKGDTIAAGKVSLRVA